jgi:Uma2 family endonuclease
MIKVEQTIEIEQYLAYERESLTKNEFLFHDIIPMAGTSYEHNIIAGNLFALIWFHLRKSNKIVFRNNMRTYNPVNQGFMYPDIVVSNGKPIFREDGKMDNLMNPVMIIEVLSPSTAVYDKTDKFIACKTIPTLQEYVLISTDKPDIEIYRRENEEHWTLVKEHDSNAKILLNSIDFEFELGEIYEEKS